MKHTIKLLIFLILLLPSVAWDATYTVTWDGDGRTDIDGDTFCDGTCVGGDIIELPAGTTNDGLYINDMVGASGNPIIIRNADNGGAGGGTILDTNDVIATPPYGYGIWIQDSRYIKIDGSNDSDVTYGIKVQDCASKGIFMNNNVQDVEIQYVWIYDIMPDSSGQIGIHWTNKITDSNVSIDQEFSNLIIHDCKVDSIGGEAMYLGTYAPSYAECDGEDDLDDAPLLHNILVYDNIVSNVEFADGIQLGCASSGGVYNNVLTDIGDVGSGVGRNGSAIVVRQCADIDVYGNFAETIADRLLFSNGNRGPLDVYNNVGKNFGADGDGDGIYSNWCREGITVRYNTLVSGPERAILIDNADTDDFLQDNLAADITNAAAFSATGGTSTGNVDKATVAECNFNDEANDDYSLTSSTPADIVDSGQASGYPSTDRAGTVRPQGESVDIGAYEYTPSGSPPPSSDWGRKCELVIQSSQVPGNLSSFPVLITAATLPEEMVDSDHADYAANQAQADGGDLRFYSDEALTNRIACKIIDFTQGATPTVEIKIIAPSVYGAANTSLWVVYNATGKSQPAADAAYGAEAVFDAGFKAVWDFEEADAGNGTVYYDSTSNDNDGTLTDADGDSTRGTGQIGASLDLNGDADFVDAGNDATLEMGLDDWTISCWVKMPADTTTGIIEKGAIGAPIEGYEFFYNTTTDDLKGFISDGTTRITSDSNDTLALDDNTWRFIAVTHDRDGNSTFYSDSAASFGTDGTDDISSFSATDITNSGRNFKMGDWGGTKYQVAYDEMRISNTLRSSDWLTATYNNQKTPNTFIVEGTPETVSDTTRATVLAIGYWDAGTDTCIFDKGITYTDPDDVIPLCVKCSEEMSVEIPGEKAGPTIGIALDYPANRTATHAGNYNDGTYGYLKLNLALSVGDRRDDLAAVDVSALSLGLSSVENAFSITNADPAVVSSTAHGLAVGGFVYFKALGEMTEILNHMYEITAVSANTFTLGDLDASGYTAESDDGDEEYQSTDVYVVDPSLNMLNPDLTAAGVDFSSSAIVIAVPYPSTAPLEIGTGETHIDINAFEAATYGVPGDHFSILNDLTGTQTFSSSGASGNRIIIEGNRKSIDLTVSGDYVTVRRVRRP